MKRLGMNPLSPGFRGKRWGEKNPLSPGFRGKGWGKKKSPSPPGFGGEGWGEGVAFRSFFHAH